jgi:hypothetical protein
MFHLIVSIIAIALVAIFGILVEHRLAPACEV